MEPLVFDGEAQLREAQTDSPQRSGDDERAGRAAPCCRRTKALDGLGGSVSAARRRDQRRSRSSRRRGLEQPVIYGHAGNGHPHQNFLARDAGELTTIEGVIEETLRIVLALGGTVAAEHGIGKIKRRWLPLQMNPLQIAMMTAVKRELDPLGILAPGNIL